MAEVCGTVRPGTVTDAVRVQRLFEGHLNWINVWYSPENVFQRQIPFGHVRLTMELFPSAVAETEDLLFGFAVSQPQDPCLLEVRNVYVDDPYRGQGVGLRLLGMLEDEARNADYRVIMATASHHWYPGKQMPTNLFEKAGYAIHKLDVGVELYTRAIPDAHPLTAWKQQATATAWLRRLTPDPLK